MGNNEPSGDTRRVCHQYEMGKGDAHIEHGVLVVCNRAKHRFTLMVDGASLTASSKVVYASGALLSN